MADLPRRFLMPGMHFREIGPSTVLGAGILHKKDSGGDVIRHTSRHLSVVYVLRGRGSYLCKTCGRVDMAPGDVYLRFPGLLHDSTHVPDGQWVEAFLSFTPGISRTLEDSGVISRRAPVLHPGLDLAVADRFVEIMKTLASSSQANLFSLVTEALRVVGELSLRANKAADGNTGVPWLAEAKRRMGMHLDERLSLPQLAKELGVGYESFRKIFTACEKVPPGDYRIQRRIGEARRLLLHYGRQVKEVALSLGYSSPAAFGAQFLAVTGMTPQQFRLHHDIG